MTHHTFHQARMQFDAARREQAELAAQALELKIAQRDALKAVAEIKAALAQLEAVKPAPMPAKPATKPTAPKAAVPAPKAAPKSKPAAPKPPPKPRASPQRIAIDGLEQRLAVIAGKVASLSKRLTP
ncbi:MAG: hypothetical protein ACK49N_03515 [Verrucomicrobiota bacterium]